VIDYTVRVTLRRSHREKGYGEPLRLSEEDGQNFGSRGIKLNWNIEMGINGSRQPSLLTRKRGCLAYR